MTFSRKVASEMIHNVIEGTWKGESILPADQTITSEEKITDFFFRVRYDGHYNTFGGIFIFNPEVSEINEHAHMVGEISGSRLMFEIRYSKFYFYADQLRKKVNTLENRILSQVKFEGSLAPNNMLYGSWETGSTIFEHEGRIVKAQGMNGTWWAKKCSNDETTVPPDNEQQ